MAESSTMATMASASTSSGVKQKLGGYDFYREVLGSPKYVVAPMVDQSELAFRILCRRYGAQVAYTPMINAHVFPFYGKKQQDKNFDVSEGEEGAQGLDRPLVVQFCGNNPDELLASARIVEAHCDAVDLNLGCPQDIAKKGHYGSWLQDEWELVYKLVNTLHENLSIPVTAKFRIFSDPERTLAYAKMLERAGAQILTVHGRTRDQRGVNSGLADWKQIAMVKQAVSVPVLANGNMLYQEDIEACLQATGADGIMSAEGLLYNPALFVGLAPPPRPSSSSSVHPLLATSSGSAPNLHPSVTALAFEYLTICRELNTHTSLGAIRGHLFKILRPALAKHTDLREKLGRARVRDKGKGWWKVRGEDGSLTEYEEIIGELEDRLKADAESHPATITADPETGLKEVPWWLTQPYIRPLPEVTSKTGSALKSRLDALRAERALSTSPETEPGMDLSALEGLDEGRLVGVSA
uniref:tRNA-dihydrouridine(16/17) synthase [NAD(P)(+)] n=2 Tax=Schizophyllum commune (strain H4-8 / FGSC 9210) TaxID=578458 RepID=D8Q1N3_SCHCM